MKKMFLSISITLSTMSHATFLCHPKINPMLTQYIVGYGSLMDEASKRKTSTAVGKNHPFFLPGFERAWNFQNAKGTFLGVKYQAQNTLSVVYFSTTPIGLHTFDQRELGYCRELLNPSSFIPLLHHQVFPKGQYWIYVPAHPKTDLQHIPAYYITLFTQACKKIAQENQSPAFLKSCQKIIPPKR